MTDHPALAASAAAHIRDLAEATKDAHEAYGSPADIASVTESLRDLARHLEKALDHLARHIDRRDGWDTTDGEQPRRYSREASGQIRSANADAHNMVRALGRSVEALVHLKSAP
ncbi:hypothetical protein MTF65_09560 [Streptomyces sp. APSN-46.1]|uniref:hypothetical protein n=1 Tax=Streptomyces sp. APSN-46.1 TaxID=2929049 RepID=UPI001FB508E3|nr:hypothetical protein [Streptomyces sp. APSN-46.1]MCJ1677578.1 hypothetical protein [Streptomyces sp. APSN-46.1]